MRQVIGWNESNHFSGAKGEGIHFFCLMLLSYEIFFSYAHSEKGKIVADRIKWIQFP